MCECETVCVSVCVCVRRGMNWTDSDAGPWEVKAVLLSDESRSLCIWPFGRAHIGCQWGTWRCETGVNHSNVPAYPPAVASPSLPRAPPGEVGHSPSPRHGRRCGSVRN